MCVPAGPTTRCEPVSHDRARPRADPAAAAPRREALNPRPHGHRDAVEPAGVDEDQRLAHRRPADRRPRDLPSPTRCYFVKFVQAYQRAGVPVDAVTRAERAAEPHTAAATPASTCPSAQEERSICGLGADAAGRRAAHQDPRLRPQLVRAPGRHRVHPAGRATRRPTTRPTCCALDAARYVDGTAYHCYCGDAAADRPARQPSRTSRDLVHRVLRLARPDDPPAQVFGDTLKWHSAQPRPRRHAQLGEVGRQLEPRARPGRRPAHRRLRHLHRRGHASAPDSTRHPQR